MRGKVLVDQTISIGVDEYPYYRYICYKIIELRYVWHIRGKILEQGITFTDFVDRFKLDPNATDTLLPSTLPTAAEYCQLFRQEMIFNQSMVMLIPSTLVLLILMFLKPRTNLCKRCLWGRPSILVHLFTRYYIATHFHSSPVNFIDEHGRRWAYCGAFAVMTSFLVDFFIQHFFWNPGYWADEQWALRFSWLKPFILLGNVIHLGYLFYPPFDCLTLRRLIPANVLGLAYAAFWVYSDASEVKECPIEPPRGATHLGVLEITRVVKIIPIFIGELAVVFAFILDLIVNSYHCHLKRTNQANKYKRKSRWGGKETLPLQYIEYLMTAHTEKPITLKEKLKRMVVYTNVLGFMYPPRVICTMSVAFVLLLTLTTELGTGFNEILIPLEQSGGVVDTMKDFLGDDGDSNFTDPDIRKIIRQAPRYVSGIRGCIIFANVAASLLHFGSMVHIILTYRNHVRMVMRGDRSWHYNYDSSPPKTLVFGLRYSGYQIAYLLWGYVIMFALVAFVSLIVTILIIIPITFGEKPFFFNQLIIAIHAYHIMSYFIFFFNIVVGAFSVIKRSLLSMIFGTLLLCRLDRCLLMRGFEKFDKGFSAYMGMLEMDATHNHPVLKGFIYILKAEVKDSREREQETRRISDAERGVAVDSKPTKRIDKRVRNKWWKLITLVNNPNLVIERLQRKVKEEREKRHDLRDDVVDMIATTGAVFTGGCALGAVSGTQDPADNI